MLRSPTCCNRQIVVGLRGGGNYGRKLRDFPFCSVDALPGTHNRHLRGSIPAPLRLAFRERVPGYTIIDGDLSETRRNLDLRRVRKISWWQGYYLETHTMDILVNTRNVEGIYNVQWENGLEKEIIWIVPWSVIRTRIATLNHGTL